MDPTVATFASNTGATVKAKRTGAPELQFPVPRGPCGPPEEVSTLPGVFRKVGMHMNGHGYWWARVLLLPEGEVVPRYRNRRSKP